MGEGLYPIGGPFCARLATLLADFFFPELLERRTVMKTLAIALAISVTSAAFAVEHHVSVKGPLKTISAAAQLAQPGDVITVHEGVYRERVAPPRGGESDARQRAAVRRAARRPGATGSRRSRGRPPGRRVPALTSR